MISEHTFKIQDGDDVFYYLPKDIKFPTGSSKYWEGLWTSDYSLFRLAYQLYGDKNLFWLILGANNIISPWDFNVGEKFRILLPEYLNEL